MFLINTNTPQTLDLFLSTGLSSYFYSVLSPLGSSDHNLITVTCSASFPPSIHKITVLYRTDTQMADPLLWNSIEIFLERSFALLRVILLCVQIEESHIVEGTEAYILYNADFLAPLKYLNHCLMVNAQTTSASLIRPWRRGSNHFPLLTARFSYARNNAKSTLRSV